MKTEIFGTMFKPNARWCCGACKRNNVSNLVPPLRAQEPVYCKKCRRLCVLTLDMEKLPRAWGGAAEPVAGEGVRHG